MGQAAKLEFKPDEKHGSSAASGGIGELKPVGGPSPTLISN
jgi:hypothetical protein